MFQTYVSTWDILLYRKKTELDFNKKIQITLVISLLYIVKQAQSMTSDVIQNGLAGDLKQL